MWCVQKSCGQGEQRLETETLVRGSDSWASISLLKDLISTLLAMVHHNTRKQDMARSAFSGSCTNVNKKTGLKTVRRP